MKEEKPIWFAMRATYRRELEAKKLLDAQSIGTFIPMRYRTSVRGNKKKRELVPVVHNLIFAYAAQSHIQRVKKDIPFLQYMVDMRSRQKIIVPDEQMKHFIAVAGTYDEQLLYFMPQEVNLSKGMKVRIRSGEFAGQEGVFVKVKGARDRRVVIQIQGIIAVAMATLHPDLIEPITEE